MNKQILFMTYGGGNMVLSRFMTALRKFCDSPEDVLPAAQVFFFGKRKPFGGKPFLSQRFPTFFQRGFTDVSRASIKTCSIIRYYILTNRFVKVN